MQVVYTKCKELIPPLSQKTIGRIRVTVYAWRSRDKVEGALRDLETNVDNCYTMFMVIFHRISNLTLSTNLIFHKLDVWSHENRATTYGSGYYLDHPKVDFDRKPDDKRPRTIFQLGCFERKNHFFSLGPVPSRCRKFPQASQKTLF